MNIQYQLSGNQGCGLHALVDRVEEIYSGENRMLCNLPLSTSFTVTLKSLIKKAQ